MTSSSLLDNQLALDLVIFHVGLMKLEFGREGYF